MNDLYCKILEFQMKEAELLNDEEYDQWLEILEDDFEYIVLTSQIQQNNKQKFTNDKYLFSADKNKWRLFIQRLKSDYGWAYRHAKTIMRRIVGNVRIVNLRGSEVLVSSSFILLRLEGDEKNYTLISGRREDVIRINNDDMKIRKRTVYIDGPYYPSYNLYFPL